MAIKEKSIASLLNALDDEACVVSVIRLENILTGQYASGKEYFRMTDEAGTEIKTVDEIKPYLVLDKMTLREPTAIAKKNDQYGSTRVIMISNVLTVSINDVLDGDNDLRLEFGQGQFRLGFICAYFNDNDTKTRLKIIGVNLHRIRG